MASLAASRLLSFYVDVCYYVDSSFTGLDFPGESEGDVHCHGFGWKEGDDVLQTILRESVLQSRPLSSVRPVLSPGVGRVLFQHRRRQTLLFPLPLI